MRWKRLAMMAALPLLGGCMQGLLYTHTWEPLTTNCCRTPFPNGSADSGASDVRDLTIKFVVPYVDPEFKWHSNAIGDIAKKYGMDEIYFADLEHFSVAFGIWKQDRVHVYGKPKTGAAPAPAPQN